MLCSVIVLLQEFCISNANVVGAKTYNSMHNNIGSVHETGNYGMSIDKCSKKKTTKQLW